MTAHDSSEDLVSSRTDFGLAWPGYNQSQVQRYMHKVEKEWQRRDADRDAAAARAERLARRLQSENSDLRATVDRISRIPIEPEGLQERSRRMIELIREEAREIIARARAAEDQIKADAEEAANLAREHHERLVAELDSRREEMENEHRNLMEHAKAQVETMEQRAEDHRQHLDREAAGVRRQAETQFEKAIAFRRSEVTRVIADAERQVGTLHEMRIRLTTELRTCRELLADALPLLHPLPDETPPDLPEQRGVLPANPTSNSRNTSAPRTTTNNLPRPQPAH